MFSIAPLLQNPVLYIIISLVTAVSLGFALLRKKPAPEPCFYKLLDATGVATAKRLGLNSVDKVTLAQFHPFFTKGRTFDKVLVSAGKFGSFWHVVDGPFTVGQLVASMKQGEFLASTLSRTSSLGNSMHSISTGFFVDNAGQPLGSGFFQTTNHLIQSIYAQFPPINYQSAMNATRLLGVEPPRMPPRYSALLPPAGIWAKSPDDIWKEVASWMAQHVQLTSRTDIELLHRISGRFAYISVLATNRSDFSTLLGIMGPTCAPIFFENWVRSRSASFSGLECCVLKQGDTWVVSSFPVGQGGDICLVDSLLVQIRREGPMLFH